MRNVGVLLACSAMAVLSLPLAAQDRPNLSGTWQFDSSKSELHTSKVAGATWVINEDDRFHSDHRERRWGQQEDRDEVHHGREGMQD